MPADDDEGVLELQIVCHLHHQVGQLIHAGGLVGQQPAQDDVVGVVKGDLNRMQGGLGIQAHMVRIGHDLIVLDEEVLQQFPRLHLGERAALDIPAVEVQQVLVHAAVVEYAAAADLLDGKRDHPDQLQRFPEASRGFA